MKTVRGDLMEMGVQFAAAIMFIGILLGAGAIALGSFTSTYEGTLDANHSKWTGTESGAVSTMGNSSSGLVNISTQMPTVGTIAGVGLIIAVLFGAIGVYVFGKMQTQ
jgi:ABC-type antimicrobial peptide transport system permease subunit